MIIDGASLREIEAESLKQQTAAALANIPTFGELAEIYWQDVKRTWKNPEKQYSLARRHLIPKLAELRVNEIDVAVIRELIYEIRERIGIPTAHLARVGPIESLIMALSTIYAPATRQNWLDQSG